MFRRAPVAGLLLAGLVFSLASAPVQGAEVEVREYTVKVDDKPVGQYAMTITQKDDGSVTMSCDADLKVKVAKLVTAYSYAYNCLEVWKDGRLQSFQSTCNDNGKKYAVKAASDSRQLRVTVNGREAKLAPAGAGAVDWEIVLDLPKDGKITAKAKDRAGNEERMGQVR